MEQSHFWEANKLPSHPLNKLPALLRHQFHYSVHNIQPPVRVLNQIIPVTVPTVPVTSVLILSFNYVIVFQMECFLQVSHHQCVDINTHNCHNSSIFHSHWWVLELLIVI